VTHRYNFLTRFLFKTTRSRTTLEFQLISTDLQTSNATQDISIDQAHSQSSASESQAANTQKTSPSMALNPVHDVLQQEVIVVGHAAQSLQQYFSPATETESVETEHESSLVLTQLSNSHEWSHYSEQEIAESMLMSQQWARAPWQPTISQWSSTSHSTSHSTQATSYNDPTYTCGCK
jgi:hypothetical protein